MKRLIVAGLFLSASVLLGGCGNSGYGTATTTPDLTGFNGNPGTPSCTNPPRPANTALYCLSAGILPYPFDAYFAGSTDGTLNIQPPNQLWPGQAALNALDGFSTTAPIREHFNGKIDAMSLATPGAVIVVHINTTNAPSATTPGKAPVLPPTGKFMPLVGCVAGGVCTGADYVVAPALDDPSILEITPLKPLAASTCLPPPPNSPCQGPNAGLGEAYMVLLTKAITVGGVPAVPDADYASFQTAIASGGPTCPSITDPNLNALCQLSGAHMGLAHALLGVDPASVVVSFSFSTESTLDTLVAAASETSPQPIKVNQAFAAPNVPMTTGTFGGLGLADVYVGVMTLPYYLATPAQGPTAPDTEYWHAAAATAPDKTSTFTTRFNPLPVATVKALQVPVLMTVPNLTSGMSKPGSGWPIVIFQHGLTADRTNLILVGDSLALAGLVGIAIDMPLHGCTPPFTDSPFCAPLYASSSNALYTGLGLPAAGSIERTFDLTTLSGGKSIDTSGSHYVALGSPLTLRDNFRESSVDLVTLAESVGTILPAGATAPYIDPTSVHFMGHSQGSIIAPAFLAAISLLPVPPILSVTLANPGGKWVYLGIESPTFGPPAIAQLEAASNGLLTQGTTPFANYERDVQTVLDSGDPWNHIAQAAATHPIHLIQVVGSTPQPAGCNLHSPPPMWCPDQVVPNDATARIIAAGGFTQAHPPGAAGPDLHAFVNFTAGVHASFVDPRLDKAVTQEMQFEAISFTGQAIPAAGIPATAPGTSLVIANPAVVQ